MKRLLLFTACIIFTFASCHKGGTGGEAILNVHILKQGGVGTVPGSQVYLKYNAQDYPGPNTGLYDENVVADFGGHATFINLRRGYYYVYVLGVDTLAGDTLGGGISYDIQEGEGERHVVVEVH
ncbi:MAG: hypothetical protein FD123_3922 [Bacteroidetes bacterium]|nr:MAG: hypothetical protein FD123_3922 [Bacteroidota bacterium]